MNVTYEQINSLNFPSRKSYHLCEKWINFPLFDYNPFVDFTDGYNL